MEKIQMQKQHMGFIGMREFMDLPWGIICSILSRLPLKSLGQFMCVSKSFCGVKNDSYFIDLHVKNAAFQPRNFILKGKPGFAGSNPKTLYLFDEGNLNTNTIKIPIIAEVKDKMLRLVGSCNGLLCLSRNKEGPLSESIVIYNPVTRDYMRVVTPFDNVGIKYFRGGISFVFDIVCKKYKVVVIYDNISVGNGMEAYIITLGESSWRKSELPFDFEFIRLASDSSRSVLCNGSLYWIMEKKTGSSSMKVILSMDISSEKFQEVGINDHGLQNPPSPCTCYYLLNSEKSLELAVHVYSDEQKQMNVWVLEDAKRGIWSHESTHYLGSFLEYKNGRKKYKRRKTSGIEIRDPKYYNCRTIGNVGDDSLLVEYENHFEGRRRQLCGLGHLVCYTPRNKSFSIDFRTDTKIPDSFDVLTFSPSIVSPKF